MLTQKELRKFSSDTLKKIIKESSKPDYKYLKKDKRNYWKILPDGYKNPYGKEFYDYVKEHNVKFSKIPSIREREMYNTEWNRRTGEINPPWHELPNWEKAIRLISYII